MKTKKPGTLTSYLTSLELFQEYVSKKGKWPYLPELDANVKNVLFNLSVSLKKWRHCITKETSSEKWDRYLNESEHLLTSEEAEDILNSKPAVDGRQALLEADKTDNPQDL